MKPASNTTTFADCHTERCDFNSETVVATMRGAIERQSETANTMATTFSIGPRVTDKNEYCALPRPTRRKTNPTPTYRKNPNADIHILVKATE
jgi:hypothetical protein